MQVPNNSHAYHQLENSISHHLSVKKAKLISVLSQLHRGVTGDTNVKKAKLISVPSQLHRGVTGDTNVKKAKLISVPSQLHRGVTGDTNVQHEWQLQFCHLSWFLLHLVLLSMWFHRPEAHQWPVPCWTVAFSVPITRRSHTQGWSNPSTTFKHVLLFFPFLWKLKETEPLVHPNHREIGTPLHRGT